MNRREFLKTTGVGLAGLATAPARAAAEEKKPDYKMLAHKNFKLGVFTSVYAGLPLEQAARRIREDGLDGVVMQYEFKDVKFDCLKPDWDVLRKINAELRKNDLAVAGLYGYYNVIDPNEDRRRKGQARIELLAKYWKRFDSPIISIETGSFDIHSEFSDDPKNHTEEGYQAVRAAFDRLAHMAEGTAAIIAIEAYWHNCIDSIERAERLLRDVSSPALKVTMDPANYFRNSQLSRMDEMLDDMFRRLGSHIVIAHAKDVLDTGMGQELPAAGKGQLDYPRFLRNLAAMDRPMYLIIEHLDISDVPRARDFVKSQIEKL